MHDLFRSAPRSRREFICSLAHSLSNVVRGAPNPLRNTARFYLAALVLLIGAEVMIQIPANVGRKQKG